MVCEIILAHKHGSGVYRRLGYLLNFSEALMKDGIAYRDVGEGREHDHMDAGGRTMSGAIVEERKLLPHRKSPY